MNNPTVVISYTGINPDSTTHEVSGKIFLDREVIRHPTFPRALDRNTVVRVVRERIQSTEKYFDSIVNVVARIGTYCVEVGTVKKA